MENDEKLSREDLDAVAGGSTSDWMRDRPSPKYAARSYVYISDESTGGTIRAYIHDDFFDYDCEYGTPAEWVYNLDGPDGTRYVRQEHEILGQA